MWSLMIAVVLCVAVGTESSCPKVSCTDDKLPCPAGTYETQSYVQTNEDGECPGCTHCLESDKYCPDLTCPFLDEVSDDCVSVLYVKVGGKECPACDVQVC